MNCSARVFVVAIVAVLLAGGNAVLIRKSLSHAGLYARGPDVESMRPRSQIHTYLLANPGTYRSANPRAYRRSLRRTYTRTHPRTYPRSYPRFFLGFYPPPFPYTLASSSSGHDDYWCGDINDPHDAEKCHKPCPDGDPGTCGEGMMCYSGIVNCAAQPSPSPSPAPTGLRYCIWTMYDGSVVHNCGSHCTSDDECIKLGFDSCPEYDEKDEEACCSQYGVDC